MIETLIPVPGRLKPYETGTPLANAIDIRNESKQEKVLETLDYIENKLVEFDERISALEAMFVDVSMVISPELVTVGVQSTISIIARSSNTISGVRFLRDGIQIYSSDQPGTSYGYLDIIQPSNVGTVNYSVEFLVNGVTVVKNKTVRVVDTEHHLNVVIGNGQSYSNAMFEDMEFPLHDNMSVTMSINSGDYIFIKVDKNDDVRNFYLHNENGGVFEWMEINLDIPQEDGDYKYYQTDISFNRLDNVEFYINKTSNN